jgi:hypothetical protein
VKLEVLATLDVKGLQFRQADGRSRNDVTFVSAIFDQDGNFIAGVQKVVQLRLRDETIAKLDQTPPLAVKADFGVKPGSYLVRLVVRDAEGRLLTAENGAVVIR